MNYKSGKVYRKFIGTVLKITKRIRIYLKHKLDSISNNKLRENILNAIPFWLGAFITGIVAVLYAKLFVLTEAATLLIYDSDKRLFFAITPACFVLSWLIVSKYAPYARGSGIPQVSASIELSNPRKYHLVNRFLSLKILFIKIASSLIMVLGGGAVGREGPTIQIAGSIFKKINDILPDWYPKISKKNMLITGAASGLAAAFNTPLGGIVFTIEELTKTHFSYFKSALITGVIIAGLTALNILGPYLYLGYPKVNNLLWWIIFPVILVALISGYAGSAMGKIILFIFKKKNLLTSSTGKIL